jgi:hypothetical protein
MYSEEEYTWKNFWIDGLCTIPTVLIVFLIFFLFEKIGIWLFICILAVWSIKENITWYKEQKMLKEHRK